MFESLGQLSQNRKDLIRSYLFDKETKYKKEQAQGHEKDAQKTQKESSSLEIIESFQCQAIQNYPNIKLYQSIFCRYNQNRKAQFLCSAKYCNKHTVICGEKSCKCASDHLKCSFILINTFMNNIVAKIQKPISKQIQLYFEAKLVLYEYMLSRISQERQSLRDWQQDINSGCEKQLFLFGFNQEQTISCSAPKILYHQNLSPHHQKCGCFPLKIRKKHIKNLKKEIITQVCNIIHKKYSSIINYLDQKIDRLQFFKECANVNSAQLLFLEFLNKQKYSIIKKQDYSSGESNIVPGNAIYQARNYGKEHCKAIDIEKLCISRIRRIWRNYSEKAFIFFVEGKIMNELFCKIKKIDFLQIYPVQQIRSNLDKIIQILGQGQKQLFGNYASKKTKQLENLNYQQLKNELSKCSGMKYDSVCISSGVKQSVIIDIQAVKQLSNLRNVIELKIRWCWQMNPQISMQIIKSMPNLKHLALLCHKKKFSQNFIAKLSQLKKIQSFQVNFHSRPEYYRNYCQDFWFFPWDILQKNNWASIEELLQLSKLPKLENIEIVATKDQKSAQIIKNMKLLKHVTLGIDARNFNLVNTNLINELINHTGLRTLALIGVEIEDSQQVDFIIANNPYLNYIIISNMGVTYNINDQTVQCMANLIQLQNFCIHSNSLITGINLCKLNNLIMLEVIRCQNVSKKAMKQALTKMHKLQHLNLSFNKWVDDEVMKGAQTCKLLTCLTLYYTQVSGKGLLQLKELIFLSVLCCGWTKINGKDLIELTNHVPSITRLNIHNLDVNDQELLEMCANCHRITHLNVRDTQITMKALLKIKDLKVVQGFSYPYQYNLLAQAGIKTYA